MHENTSKHTKMHRGSVEELFHVYNESIGLGKKKITWSESMELRAVFCFFLSIIE